MRRESACAPRPLPGREAPGGHIRNSLRGNLLLAPGSHFISPNGLSGLTPSHPHPDLARPARGEVDGTRSRPQELEPHLAGPSPATIRAQLGEELRRLRQADYEAEYREAQERIRDALLELEGPNMREQLREQLRQWFIECR